MNASEKSLWIQLVAAGLAFAVAFILIPWFGDRAVGGFAVMAIGGIAGLVVGRKGVVVDERDLAIQKAAINIGWRVACWILFAGLLLLIGGYLGIQAVAKSHLTWLVWIAATAALLTKGLIGVNAYRKDRRASQS